MSENADSSERVAAALRRLAFQSPKLNDLTPDQLEEISRLVVLSTLTSDMKRLADFVTVNYPAEQKLFLETASKSKSCGTLSAYSYGLAKFDKWAASTGVNPLHVTRKQADEYIYTLCASGRAASSIRLTITAASSFFRFLERRYDFVNNPFRGTRARPSLRSRRTVVVPTDNEFALIISKAEPFERAAIVVMSQLGLRVGALPTLMISKGKFTGRSKGKEVFGTITEATSEAIAAAGLDARSPFEGIHPSQISHRLRSLSRRLTRQGLVRDPFSAHDYRHYFAVTNYQKHHDIYRLMVQLGHSEISTTASYLRSIHVNP